MLTEIFPGQFIEAKDVIRITYNRVGRDYFSEVTLIDGKVISSEKFYTAEKAIEVCREAAEAINEATKAARPQIVYSSVV